MIARIIEFSARNKFIIILLVIAAVTWGYWALRNTPLDAIPDLSDTQVIIFTEWQGRSPISSKTRSPIPSPRPSFQHRRSRWSGDFPSSGALSFTSSSMRGTDIYWARSRVLEYLQAVRSKLPGDANPVLGPDATSLGWGFSYALVDDAGKHDLAELRSIQDYYVKLAIESVPGVSQVASIGGFVKQYQVIVDPNRLVAFNIPITRVMEAIRKSNRDVEGRVLSWRRRVSDPGEGVHPDPEGPGNHPCGQPERDTGLPA